MRCVPRDAVAMVERRTCPAPPGYRRSHHPITYSYAGGSAPQNMGSFTTETDFQNGTWIDGEFYASEERRGGHKKRTKEEAMLGVFGSDSDDSECSRRPSCCPILFPHGLAKSMDAVIFGDDVTDSAIQRRSQQPLNRR